MRTLSEKYKEEVEKPCCPECKYQDNYCCKEVKGFNRGIKQSYLSAIDCMIELVESYEEFDIPLPTESKVFIQQIQFNQKYYLKQQRELIEKES